MQPLTSLPGFLGTEGKRALVVGGSAAAAWKAELCPAAGASVDVFTVEVSEEISSLGEAPPRGALSIRRRNWEAADFTGAAIAIGGFEDDREAARFADLARAAGVPVNVIDNPALSDFSFGAIVNRSPLVIGVSTDGAAPAFAQAIRARLEAMIPHGFALWVQAAQQWRQAVQASGLAFGARRRLWQMFAAHAPAPPDR